MRKFLLGASALVLVFTMSKCTYNAPAAYAGLFEGCTNTWVGGKLTKTGTCDLGYSKSKTGKVSVQVTRKVRDPITGEVTGTKTVTVRENRP
jgi:hypothetical protein